MVRFFLFIVIVGGTGLVMHMTNPGPEDYLAKLQERSEVIGEVAGQAFSEVRGNNPIDEMVAAQTTSYLLDRTQHDDYIVASIFTTDYEDPRYGPRRVRTYGLFSTLLTFRAE